MKTKLLFSLNVLMLFISCILFTSCGIKYNYAEAEVLEMQFYKSPGGIAARSDVLVVKLRYIKNNSLDVVQFEGSCARELNILIEKGDTLEIGKSNHHKLHDAYELTRNGKCYYGDE